jgi:putative transposase
MLTFSCRARLALFNLDQHKDGFALDLARARERLGFQLHAWVIMPEHVHLIVTPRLPEVTVPRILRAVKGPIAQRAARAWKADPPPDQRLRDRDGSIRFWQRGGGYDRNIRWHDDLREKIAYLHANPVRRGLVSSPTDWLWSSARWWAGERGDTIECDWVGDGEIGG